MRRERVLGFLVSLLLWGGCDDPSRLQPLPSTDAGAPRAVCDPTDNVRLLNDVLNCGECGVSCPGEYSDSCVLGECSCGGGQICSTGSGCRAGACLAAERFQTCVEDEDCETWQECVLDVSGAPRCIAQCEFDGECFPGYACIEGACSFVTCAPEECDGRDNDCDGSVDEAAPGVPLSRYCFSGPAEMLETLSVVPPCRLGVQVCEPGGVWSSCRGEVPPRPEVGLLACDGIDNDCDECPDGRREGDMCVSLVPSGFDVVFLIDVSGSMSNFISTVKESVRIFSSGFDRSQPISFGIVLVDEPQPLLYHDLSPIEPFQVALEMLPRSSFAREPSWDALWEVATGVIPLSWTSGRSRIIILFTDEEGQSYHRDRGVGPNITPADICSSLMMGEAIFTLTEPRYYDYFDDCGVVWPLTESVEEMTSYLAGAISEPCLRRTATASP